MQKIIFLDSVSRIEKAEVNIRGEEPFANTNPLSVTWSGSQY